MSDLHGNIQQSEDVALFHTFCLKCIETYGKDKREGDTLTCPMCRREFRVPVGGLSKLSSNFCMERLASTVEIVPRLITTVASATKQSCVEHPNKQIEFYCKKL